MQLIYRIHFSNHLIMALMSRSSGLFHLYSTSNSSACHLRTVQEELYVCKFFSPAKSTWTAVQFCTREVLSVQHRCALMREVEVWPHCSVLPLSSDQLLNIAIDLRPASPPAPNCLCPSRPAVLICSALPLHTEMRSVQRTVLLFNYENSTVQHSTAQHMHKFSTLHNTGL